MAGGGEPEKPGGPTASPSQGGQEPPTPETHPVGLGFSLQQAEEELGGPLLVVELDGRGDGLVVGQDLRLGGCSSQAQEQQSSPSGGHVAQMPSPRGKLSLLETPLGSALFMAPLFLSAEGGWGGGTGGFPPIATTTHSPPPQPRKCGFGVQPPREGGGGGWRAGGALSKSLLCNGAFGEAPGGLWVRRDRRDGGGFSVLGGTPNGMGQPSQPISWKKLSWRL